MTAYRRARVAGGVFFFTLVTFERRQILTENRSLPCLRKAWAETRRRFGFHTDALCVLPDHLHCLIRLPVDDANFSMRWAFFKGTFTRLYLKHGGEDGIRNRSRLRKGEAAIWQRRFWEHCIRGETDWRAHMDYVHYNPVKHRLANSPSDWPWSTFHRCVEKGFYPADWGQQAPPTLVAWRDDWE